MSKKTSPSQAEEKKPVFSQEMAQDALDLRGLYLSLTDLEKAAVVHFFNLHNNAGWIYNELISQAARDYIDRQVLYSQELAELERVAKEESSNFDQKHGDEGL